MGHFLPVFCAAGPEPQSAKRPSGTEVLKIHFRCVVA